MAFNPILSDMISHACTAAETLRQLKGVLDEMNVLYDAGGGFKVAMTSEEEAEMAVIFNGLTKQQLDDGMYVLTATIRSDLITAFNQLIALAARA